MTTGLSAQVKAPVLLNYSIIIADREYNQTFYKIFSSTLFLLWTMDFSKFLKLLSCFFTITKHHNCKKLSVVLHVLKKSSVIV